MSNHSLFPLVTISEKLRNSIHLMVIFTLLQTRKLLQQKENEAYLQAGSRLGNSAILPVGFINESLYRRRHFAQLNSYGYHQLRNTNVVSI